MNRRCVFSACRRWRFTLWREWGSDALEFEAPARGRQSFLAVIGLNPSTADETQDDPTIRRCVNFAKAWGFGALGMLNLFGWRDTDPRGMKAAPDPIGSENDRWILELARGAGLTLAAWGTHGSHLDRGSRVAAMLAREGIALHSLGINADGSPRHPLYVPAKVSPRLFAPSPILPRPPQ